MPKFKSLLLLVCLLSAACSRIQIAYDWADTVILTYIDKYFDLTSAQKDILRPKIRADLRLLLEKDIPPACSYLEDFIKMAEKKTVTREEIIAYEKRGEDLVLTALKRIEPNVQEFFKMITPQQIEYYKKKIKKQMDEHDEKFKSQDKQRDEMERRIESQFEIVGLELNRDQNKMLEAFLDQGQFPIVLEKKSRRTNIEGFLEAAKDQTKFKNFIAEVFQNPGKFRSEEYKKVHEAYRLRFADLKVKILRSLPQGQRKEIKETLTKLVRQLEELRVEEGFTAR